MTKWIAIGALSSALVAGTAYAGSYEDFNAGLVMFNHGESDAAIRYFTAALGPGDLPHYLVHIAYYDRAVAYRSKKQDDEALADLESAKRANPDFKQAYLDMAEIYRQRGKFDQALEAYNTVAKLDETDTAPYMGRSHVYSDQGKADEAIAEWDALEKMIPDAVGFYSQNGMVQWKFGRYADAAAAFQKAADVPASQPYTALWLWLALHRSNADDAPVAQAARKWRTSNWPRPVIDLFLGDADPDDVFKAAAQSPAPVLADRTCEANFYVGEWYLQKRDNVAAKPLLQKAAADCPENFVEREPAQDEIKRLP